MSRLVLPLTAILLILISIYSYTKLSELIRFNNEIKRTMEIQKELETVMSHLKDAETGQRGFLITNDTSFSSKYFLSNELIHKSKSRLIEIVQNDPIQLRMIDSLFFKVQKRINRLSVAISVRDELMKEGNEPARVKLMSVGLEYMNSAISFADSIKARQQQLIRQQQDRISKAESMTPFLLLTLSLFSLLMIVYSYVSITNELRQKSKFQKELEQKIEELNRSNNELEQFAYVASHDLQEPLRKIRSFGDRLLLRNSAALSPEIIESINKMQSAAARMQILIDDLLTFSRLVNVKGNFEAVSLNNVITDVLSDLEESIRQKSGRIEVENLPVIQGVPSQLRQLFQNLISNALKFSKEKENPIIRINSELVRRSELPEGVLLRGVDTYYKITVNDNGIGFDEKYLDRIFVIFQRLHGKMEYGGTGIGLAVTKKIMSLHSGFITAKSKPGEGSAFILFFPAKHEEKSQANVSNVS